MDQWNLALALVAGLVLVLSLATGLIRSKWYLPSEPIVAMACGIAIGPYGYGVLDLTSWGETLAILEEVARLTIAIAVMSAALRLPPGYYRERLRALVVVLGPVMVAMWLTSAVVVVTILDVPLLLALLAGAVLAPTDPVLANAIVVGRVAEVNIPSQLRYLLSGEAGINDGAAHPFVFLPILLLSGPVETVLLEWATRSVLREVVGGIVAGAVVGAIAGRVEQRASAREFLEETSVFTVTVALTFAVLGAVELLGANGILGVFLAGAAYNWQADPGDEAEEQRVEEVFNRLFTLPVFVLFGLALPWTDWAALGWRGPALVAGVLLLRRLPVILSVRRVVPPIATRPASLFVGWFGPIGVAAIFYATLAVRHTGSNVPWIVASLVVAGSVLVHGVTATPFTRMYGHLEVEAPSW